MLGSVSVGQRPAGGAPVPLADRVQRAGAASSAATTGVGCVVEKAKTMQVPVELSVIGNVESIRRSRCARASTVRSSACTSAKARTYARASRCSRSMRGRTRSRSSARRPTPRAIGCSCAGRARREARLDADRAEVDLGARIRPAHTAADTLRATLQADRSVARQRAAQPRLHQDLGADLRARRQPADHRRQPGQGQRRSAARRHPPAQPDPRVVRGAGRSLVEIRRYRGQERPAGAGRGARRRERHRRTASSASSTTPSTSRPARSRSRRRSRTTTSALARTVRRREDDAVVAAERDRGSGARGAERTARRTGVRRHRRDDGASAAGEDRHARRRSRSSIEAASRRASGGHRRPAQPRGRRKVVSRPPSPTGRSARRGSAAVTAHGGDATRQPARQRICAVHPPASRDAAGDARAAAFRRRSATAAAGERPAERRLPDDHGHAQPARRQPGDDGLGRGHAAREAVLDDRRHRLDDLDQRARQSRRSRCSSTSTATSTPPRRTCRRRSRTRHGSCRRTCRRRRRTRR